MRRWQVCWGISCQKEWHPIIEPSDKPAIEFWTKMELGNDPEAQLYNIAQDPSEKTNVAEEHQDIVKKLSSLLTEIKERQ